MKMIDTLLWSIVEKNMTFVIIDFGSMIRLNSKKFLYDESSIRC